MRIVAHMAIHPRTSAPKNTDKVDCSLGEVSRVARGGGTEGVQGARHIVGLVSYMQHTRGYRKQSNQHSHAV